MSTKKAGLEIRLNTAEAKALSSMFLATALVLLASYLPFAYLGVVQAVAGLYLFFFPVGFLMFKAFKESDSLEETIALSLALSITVNVLAIMAGFMVAGIPFNFINSLLTINLLGVIFYTVNRWRNG